MPSDQPTLVARRNFAESLAIAMAIVLLVVCGGLTFQSLERLNRNRERVKHTKDVLLKIEATESAVKDTETGQLGFIITGREDYLVPFDAAVSRIGDRLLELASLTEDNNDHRAKVEDLRRSIDMKLDELRHDIDVRRTQGLDATIEAVKTDLGKRTMDTIRSQVANMRDIETNLLYSREQAVQQSFQSGKVTSVVTTLLGIALVGGIAFVVIRNRRRAEIAAEAIEAERVRLQVTLASIGDAVISTDIDGRVTNINAVAESLTGWNRQQADGMPLTTIFNIVNETTRLPVENPAVRALAEGTIVGLAHHTILIAKDGSEKPIDDSAAPIRDMTGNVIGCVLVFRDISARIENEVQMGKVERRLQATEKQVQMALDSADLGTWHIDIETMTLRSDERFQKIFQIGSEPLAYENAIQHVHPGDQDRVRVAVAAATRPIDPIPYAIEYRIVHNNGNIRWVFAKGRANFVDDKIVSFDGTLADVTDLKHTEMLARSAEVRFRMLADHIPQLAWIADAGSDGRVNWFNKNWYEYTGTTLEQVRGSGWHDVQHPDHADRVIRKFQEHVRLGTDWEDTFPLRGKDGNYRWFLSRMNVIRDELGNAIQLFGTNTDVTEQLNLAESLRQSAEELSEADRRKNEFLATLAHELRNPLAPIKNAVQLMAMTKLDDDTEDLRQTMARQVEQLVRLIDDLLDVSRISRGKISLRRSVVELKAAIESAVEASLGFIKEGGQTLSVSFVEQNIYVDGDPSRLAQVVSNLLNNAAKYSEAGCHIELNVTSSEGKAIIEVRDNGIGIEADHLQSIFLMFSQIDTSLERGSAGLGIGLTLVKSIVELHGGIVSADSKGLGKGSTFTVELPTVLQPTLPIESVGIARTARTASTRSFRILVVEDQRALRLVLTRLLEKMGHEARGAESGTAAIAVIETYFPEIIFSDISMPGMTGYELVGRLRQMPVLAKTYFVAMTGYGQNADRETAIESGFDEHMVKPVDVERLLELFTRLESSI